MPFWAQFSADSIRRCHYAGTWYESNTEKLKLQLANFLAQTKTEHKNNQPLTESKPISGEIEAIIVPHAGYIFSGQTAAFAYQSLKNQQIKRIFLLGPSHHQAFRGAGLPQALSFETPLGNLEVDKNLINELHSYPLFSFEPEAHKLEHSLELQLPFIKQLFSKAKIVPIIIGHLNDESEAHLIADTLKSYISKGDLVIVSSDFTHYGPRYGYTPFTSEISNNIRQLDKQAFNYLSKLDFTGFSDFQRRTGDTICGVAPCKVLLSLLPKESYGSLLEYTSSGELKKDDGDNSVSYLAIAFCGPGWPQEPGKQSSIKKALFLSAEDKQTLLTLASKTLESYVTKQRLPSATELNLKISPSMKVCSGVFVTLTKREPLGKATEHKQLRGCIGSIYPARPLYQAVQENTVSAASKDYRFKPVENSELALIDLEINVLTAPQKVASYNDIVLGRDGIILSKRGQQAVFLPQVATEWGWSLEETLTQLSLKAGLTADDWKTGAQFEVFQSEEFH